LEGEVVGVDGVGLAVGDAHAHAREGVARQNALVARGLGALFARRDELGRNVGADDPVLKLKLDALTDSCVIAAASTGPGTPAWINAQDSSARLFSLFVQNFLATVTPFLKACFFPCRLKASNSTI
jgi:hypothetical protein